MVGGAERTEQEEIVVAESCDRELADDRAVLVEHRGQVDAPDLRQRLVNRPCSQSAAPGPATLYFEKLRDLGQTDPLADGEGFLADEIERVGAAERDALDRLLAGALEPER